MNLRPLKHAATLDPEQLPESTDPDFLFPYIDIGSVDAEGRIQQTDPIRFADSPSRARKIVRPGDSIVSTVRTYLRVIATITENEAGAIASTGFAVLRPNAHVDPKFLAWAVQSIPFIEETVARSTGISYPAISSSRLGEIPICCPDVDAQRAIAAFLDGETARIDALIDAKKRLLAKMNEAATRYEQAQAFGHGANENAVEAPDGGIHSSYSTVRNRHLFRDIHDLSTTGDEELLTVSHKDGVRRRADKEVYMFMAETHVGYKRCQSGDLVINTMWAWMGAAGTSDYEGIVSPAYNVYRPSSELQSEYIDTVIRTPAYVKWMGCNSTGVWKSRLRLYPQYFLNLYFPVPNLEEQRIIIARIQARRQKSEALRRPLLLSIELARERRQALITQAVTGQLKIPMDPIHG